MINLLSDKRFLAIYSCCSTAALAFTVLWLLFSEAYSNI
jgi:hypothetical protein